MKHQLLTLAALLLAFMNLAHPGFAQSPNNWIKITDGPFQNLVISEQSVWFGIRADGVFKSTNQGASWSRTSYDPPGRVGYQTQGGAVAAGNDIYVSGVDDGDFISRDEGLSWQLTGLNGFGTGSPTMAYNGVNVLAGHGGFLRGIHRRVNDAWMPVLSGVDAIKIVSDPSGIFYAAMGPQAGSGLYRSADNGETWEKVSTLTGALAVGPGRLFLLHDSLDVYQSDDGGIVWRKLSRLPVNASVTFKDIAYFGGRLFAAADPIGLFEADLDSMVWKLVPGGPAITRRFTTAANRLFLATEEGLFALNDLSPRRALATATVVNGFVVGFTILDPGYGYTNTVIPAVQIIGGDGSGAIATATVSNGQVNRIDVVNPGKGYPDKITVLIDPPPRSPSLEILVSRVKVKMLVTQGHKYLLESSRDLKAWTIVEGIFAAPTDTLVREFEVAAIGRFYRIREVP